MSSKLAIAKNNALRAHLHYQEGFYWLDTPSHEMIPEQLNAFIALLPGPTVIRVAGRTCQQRVVITLLQGDQALGVELVHRYLLEQRFPEYTLLFVIVSVQAACFGALFSHRQLPGHRNLERCFHEPYSGEQGQLAGHLRDLLVKLSPEFILDIHNNRRACLTFALALTSDTSTQHLSAAFSQHLLVGSPQEGALIDLDLDCPVVAVIFSNQDALEPTTCFERFVAVIEKPLDSSSEQPLPSLLTTPYRLEVRSGASLAFADKPVFGMNVTLRQDLPSLCAQHCLPGEPLGWVDHNQLDHFRLGRHDQPCQVNDFFDASSQRLIVRQPIRVMMAAAAPREAKEDFVLLFCTQ